MLLKLINFFTEHLIFLIVTSLKNVFEIFSTILTEPPHIKVRSNQCVQRLHSSTKNLLIRILLHWNLLNQRYLITKTSSKFKPPKAAPAKSLLNLEFDILCSLFSATFRTIDSENTSKGDESSSREIWSSQPKRPSRSHKFLPCACKVSQLPGSTPFSASERTREFMGVNGRPFEATRRRKLNFKQRWTLVKVITVEVSEESWSTAVITSRESLSPNFSCQDEEQSSPFRCLLNIKMAPA